LLTTRAREALMMAGAGGAMRATGWRATAIRFQQFGEGLPLNVATSSSLSRISGWRSRSLSLGEGLPDSTGARDEIGDQIVQTPAASLDEMMLKIRVAGWCVNAEISLEQDWTANPDEDAQELVALNSLRDDIKRLSQPNLVAAELKDSPV
jgi:hypothetical protein